MVSFFICFILAFSNSVACHVISRESSVAFVYDTSQWKEITTKDGFILDIRYATANNFTKSKIYPCARFFLRKEPAAALLRANKEFRSIGYQLVLYDGYRPGPAQQRLWDKVPDPTYVADPKKGSMHNRGAAIDVSLADLNGKYLDMGTEYDFFGHEAHTDHTDLPSQVLKNRSLLKNILLKHGFTGIRTEWWHFSYRAKSYPLDSWEWKCP